MEYYKKHPELTIACPNFNSLNILDTLLWKNPVTGLESRLGEQISNGVVINPQLENIGAEIDLLINNSYARFLGEGEDGQVFVSYIGKIPIVIKKYFSVEELAKRKRNKNFITNGISQFRCMRKIRLLWHEAPEVYAASETALAMDYISDQPLPEYLTKLDVDEKEIVDREWADHIHNLRRIMPEEEIDGAEFNGYVKFTGQGHKLGVLDQG